MMMIWPTHGKKCVRYALHSKTAWLKENVFDRLFFQKPLGCQKTSGSDLAIAHSCHRSLHPLPELRSWELLDSHEHIDDSLFSPQRSYRPHCCSSPLLAILLCEQLALQQKEPLVISHYASSNDIWSNSRMTISKFYFLNQIQVINLVSSSTIDSVSLSKLITCIWLRK